MVRGHDSGRGKPDPHPEPHGGVPVREALLESAKIGGGRIRDRSVRGQQEHKRDRARGDRPPTAAVPEPGDDPPERERGEEPQRDQKILRVAGRADHLIPGAEGEQRRQAHRGDPGEGVRAEPLEEDEPPGTCAARDHERERNEPEDPCGRCHLPAGPGQRDNDEHHGSDRHARPDDGKVPQDRPIGGQSGSRSRTRRALRDGTPPPDEQAEEEHERDGGQDDRRRFEGGEGVERSAEHVLLERRRIEEPVREGGRRQGPHDRELTDRQPSAPPTGDRQLEQDQAPERRDQEEVRREVMSDDQGAPRQSEGEVPSHVAASLDEHPERRHHEQVAERQGRRVGEGEHPRHGDRGEPGAEQRDQVVGEQASEQEEQGNDREDGEDGNGDLERGQRVRARGPRDAGGDDVDPWKILVPVSPPGVAAEG